MSETNFASPDPTTDVPIGLVVEDQRTGDLRRVIYADSRVVLVRDESGHTTLIPRETFESYLDTRFRVRRGVDSDIEGGQYERLRERLAEYERGEGRKARHKADALGEALDLFVGRSGEGDAAQEATDGATETVAFEEIPGIGPETAGTLRSHGFVTAADVRAASDEELLGVAGIGGETLANIREHVD